MRKMAGLFGGGLFLMAAGYGVPRLYDISVSTVGSMAATQWMLRCSAPSAYVTPAILVGCSEGRSILTFGWVAMGVGLSLCLYGAWSGWRRSRSMEHRLNRIND